MEKGRMRGIQGYIFPVAAGFIGGVAAALIMMLLAALAALALKLSDGGLRLLVWLPAVLGGFAAGGEIFPEFSRFCAGCRCWKFGRSLV